MTAALQLRDFAPLCVSGPMPEGCAPEFGPISTNPPLCGRGRGIVGLQSRSGDLQWHPGKEQGKFLTAVPTLRPWHGKFMELLDDVVYQDSNGRLWLTPRGFILDGASIPIIATGKFPRWDRRYLRSACIHDGRFCAHDCTFRGSNALFDETLTVERFAARRLFVRAVGSPCGWWGYHVTPNIPENTPAIAEIHEWNRTETNRRLAS